MLRLFWDMLTQLLILGMLALSVYEIWNGRTAEATYSLLLAMFLELSQHTERGKP